MNNQTCVDAMLIERSQKGDQYAIDELLRQYHGKAFKYALKMTKHVEEASDVVSEAFLRVYGAIDRFKSNSSFSSWMFRILKNCFLDARKKRRVNVVASLDAGLETSEGMAYMQPIDPSDSAFEPLAADEFDCQVRALVERLPAQQRELLQMYYKEELSYDQIAERMVLPAGTVKSRLHRTKLTLRDMIRNDDDLCELEPPMGRANPTHSA